MLRRPMAMRPRLARYLAGHLAAAVPFARPRAWLVVLNLRIVRRWTCAPLCLFLWP